MIEVKIPHKAWDDSSNELRCEAVEALGGGQCKRAVVEGHKYCGKHIQSHAWRAEQQSLNLYRVRKYEQRIREFKEATGAKGLDEEIGILRMMVEEMLNKCDTRDELLLYSPRIGQLITQITKLMVAADRLAERTGMLLDRNQAVLIGQKLLEIISTRVQDQDVLAKIADDILMAFTEPLLSAEAAANHTMKAITAR